MESLADRLKCVRGKMTQKDFSKKINVSQSSYSLYEQGQRVPDADILNRICDLFGVDPGWLLVGRGSMYESGKTSDMSEVLGDVNIQPIDFTDSEDKKTSDVSEILEEGLTARCLRLADDNADLLRHNGDLRVEVERLRMDIERRDARIAELERLLAEALTPQGGQALLDKGRAAAG